LAPIDGVVPWAVGAKEFGPWLVMDFSVAEDGVLVDGAWSFLLPQPASTPIRARPDSPTPAAIRRIVNVRTVTSQHCIGSTLGTGR
jgi:hypothetical protein